MTIKETNPYWTKLTKPIRDIEFTDAMNSADLNSFSNGKFTLKERFMNIYRFERNLKNKLMEYVNLTPLQHYYIINGITQGIDSWLHGKSSIGVVNNDYTYYEKISHARGISIVDPSSKCDGVIISCPFSYNGATNFQQKIVYDCAERNIPIFIDLAYLGLTNKFTLDISHNKKVTVAYSMSKHYSLCFDRIGILWSSEPDRELEIMNQVGYVNITGIQRSQILIDQFPMDFIYQKYQNQYAAIIDALQLTATECILFGHKGVDKYCITEYL